MTITTKQLQHNTKPLQTQYNTIIKSYTKPITQHYNAITIAITTP